MLVYTHPYPLFRKEFSLLAHELDMTGACSSDRLLCILQTSLLDLALLLLVEDIVIMCSHALSELVIGPYERVLVFGKSYLSVAGSAYLRFLASSLWPGSAPPCIGPSSG